MIENQKLTSTILKRDQSLLSEDMGNCIEQIQSAIESSRVLVIGAAGSIGGSFVKVLCQFRIGSLHLVDISENSLVEVVRDLRSSGIELPEDFRTYAIDFSQPEFFALLKSESYDYVLNFSALKHVRSERDPYTLMRLLEVNVLANEALVKALDGTRTQRVFSVSSDKSVRPANIMGASKALMERVFLANSDRVSFSSARFANVAFSAGSLLDSFQRRLAKFQPLSAPNDVKRYFISHEEAGQLCFLGCFLGNNREIFYPKFKQSHDMLSFAEIARLVLKSNGLSPVECKSDTEAIQMSKSLTSSSTEWPCYFSGSDTSGEKPYEEFVDPSEDHDADRFTKVGVITDPAFHGADTVSESLSTIRKLRNSGQWTKEQLVDAVRIAVPELNHIQSDKNLDQKM